MKNSKNIISMFILFALLIARPAAGDASYAELGAAIDALLRRSDIGT